MTLTATPPNPVPPKPLSPNPIFPDPISSNAISSGPVPAAGSTPPTGAIQDQAQDQAEHRRMLGALAITLFLDAGLSVAAYAVTRWIGYSPFTALIVGAVVAGIRAVWVIVRRRQLDPFALFMVGVFTFGLLLSLLTGSPRFLLVKESFATGAAGLAFVLTCLRGKPLAYHASQRVAAPTEDERQEWEQLWATEPIFRYRFRVMSVVIGGALLVEALVRIPLIFALPIDAMAVLSPLLTPLVIAGASIWTMRYGSGTERAVAEAHRVAAEGR